jgi:hypothetical protein
VLLPAERALEIGASSYLEQAENKGLEKVNPLPIE